MYYYTKTFLLKWFLPVVMLAVFTTAETNGQVTTLWEKSQLTSTQPFYIGTANNERGIGYGFVNGNHRLYVATVTGGPQAIILNADTGDSVGVLSGTGIAGGTFLLTDIGVSSDGVIFGSNLVTSSAAGTPFKLYKWATEASTPVEVGTYATGALRLGDKITVVGSTADNSIAIYAVAASNNKIIKFTTTDNGATFTGAEILVSGLSSGTSPSVAPINNGVDGYWVKGGGVSLRKINGDLTLETALMADLSPTNGNSVRYFTIGGKNFLVNYQNGNTTTITGATSFYERARILEVVTPNSAFPVAQTSRLGTNSNPNAQGDVEVRINGNGTVTVYVFSTNNGIGAYNFDPTNTSYYFNQASTEDFSGSWPPLNWTRYTGFLYGALTPATGTWVPDDFGNVTTTLDRAARINIFGTTVRGLFVSPTIDLGSGTPAKQVEFDMALTNFAGTNPVTLGVDDSLIVIVSTDNGLTWDYANIRKVYTSASTISNIGQAETVSLAGFSGLIKVGFFGISTVSNGDNDLFIDNFKIGNVPLTPVFGVSPTNRNFGSLQIGTSTAAQQFTISNSGASDLIITSLSKTGAGAAQFTLTDPNSYPLTITPGNSANFSVAYSPVDTGEAVAEISIVHNAPGSPGTVELSGYGADYKIYTLPYYQNFDSTNGVVPPSGWLNVDNKWSRGTEARSLPYAVRTTYNHGSAGGAILQMPFINLPANAKITFWWKDDDITAGKPAGIEKEDEFGNTYMYYPESPEVIGQDTTFFEVSIDGGQNWTTLGFLSAPAAQADYEQAVFDLSAFAGNNRLLRWRDVTNNSGSAWGVGIDDIVIEEIPPITIDWGNLQWPPDATITQGETANIYAQAYKAGVTDSAGQAFGLDAWIGVSATNTNPNTWTNWIPATFNTQNGNNDEFVAAIGAGLAPGTYYYASRFQYLNGPYRYGGLNNNFWDSTAHPSGVLTVNPFVVTTLPYTEGFDSLTFPPSYWARIDVNGGTTWNRTTTNVYSGTGAAMYGYSGTLPGDDWLITPALSLTSGKVYSVTYYYRAQTSAFPERLRVAFGNAQNVAAMTNVLAEHPNIVNAVYESNTVFITPGSTGLYYVGFQSYSTPDQWNLYLDNIVVNELPEVDYSVVGYPQINGIPDPYSVSVVTKTELEIEIVPSGAGTVSSDVIRTNFTVDENSYTDGASLTPVNLKALVRRLGATGPAFAVNNGFDGMAGSVINRPGINEVGGVDSVDVSFTPSAKGTFTAWAYTTATGDITPENDTLRNFKVLVYPTPNIRFINDNGAQTAPTSVGFGANNLPLTAVVRFTTTSDVKLENIDAIYRNEASTDSIEVKIYSAGTDTLAPGAVIYSKKFAGENYINSGAGLAYVTLPLGADAPIIMANNDYWVGVSFVSSIQFPMGAHAGAIPVAGRSFLSSDGGTWFPLVLSSVPYAWYLRAVATAYTPPPPLTTVWQTSVAGGNVPSWFSTTGSTERGMGAGRVMTAPPSREMVERIFIPSRNGSTSVRVVDALTGADAGTLSVTGISGGLFVVNDAGVTEDGKILVGNMTTDATNPANPFKVYMYDHLGSDPAVAIAYTSALAERLGDKFFVRGNYAAGTAEVWAAVANQPKVLKWTMSGGTFNQTPQVITLSVAITAGSPAVLPLPNGDFYYNGNGISPIRFSSTGTALDTVPGGIVASGSNAMVYLGAINRTTDEYIAVFQYGAGNENFRVFVVPDGNSKLATVYGVSNTLGGNGNGNGTGDVAMRVLENGTRVVYVMSTNNGFSAVVTTAVIPVEFASFNASISGRDVNLTWVTSTETNSKEFVVERKSVDGWNSIGSVEAAGTSTSNIAYSFADRNLETGKYSYRLRQIDLDGTFMYSDVVEVEVGTPVTFELSQNFPNPFNPSTRINFSIPTESNVTLELYDVQGQRIAILFQGNLSAGYHVNDLDAVRYGLSSGVYIYRLNAVDNSTGKVFVSNKKMVLMK